MEVLLLKDSFLEEMKEFDRLNHDTPLSESHAQQFSSENILGNVSTDQARNLGLQERKDHYEKDLRH